MALYSEKYPAIGESYGLSVVAGALRAQLGSALERVELIDKVETGSEDCEDVVQAVAVSRPNVLGISVQYGTFSVLCREYPRIRAALPDEDVLIVFGGPLASYLGDDILAEVEPDGFVVEGEGDNAFPELVRTWMARSDPSDVPNIRYRAPTAGTVSTSRSLGRVAADALPYRQHAPAIAESGGQVFVEASRGCTWAACTFCLRGLTDIKGRPSEYRGIPLERLRRDIDQLADAGVRTFTFADEDFLGGPLERIEQVAVALERQVETCGTLSFDISVTIESILGSRDSESDAVRRHSVLERLKNAGLRKAFLGIESGSDAQLRRFNKGHSPSECAEAVRRLRALGVLVEVGFIMFDPLCTLVEIEENLDFLRDEDLISHVSALTNEMRLQRGSRYLRLLERPGAYRHWPLRSALNRDTLSYEYRYEDAGVQALVEAVRATNAEGYSMAYPLKALTRHGGESALGPLTDVARSGLRTIRLAQHAGLLAAAKAVGSGGPPSIYGEHVFPALEDAARRITAAAAADGDRHGAHPVVESVLVAAGRIAEAGISR